MGRGWLDHDVVEFKSTWLESRSLLMLLELGVAIFAVVTMPVLVIAFRARKNKTSYQ